MHRKQHAAGISLLELLVAMGIVAVLAAITFSALRPLRDATALNSAAEQGISVLNEARAKTLSSLSEARYGVHFEQGNVIVFKGTSYNPSDPENSAVPIPTQVEISAITLNGGGSDVVFKRLTGATDAYGTVVFRLKGNIAKTRTITITSAGAFNF